MSEQSNVVAGRRMTISHQDFEARCERLILEEQKKRDWSDIFLIDTLCQAVRLSREHCDMAEITPKHVEGKSLQIYVTKTGKVRIHSNGEWKPPRKRLTPRIKSAKVRATI